MSVPGRQVDDQNRTSDGRFAETPRTDPGQLDLPDEINMWTLEGTFEYPPMPSTAAECVNFWSTVEIPDTVLEATRIAYRQRRLNELEREGILWRRDNPEPRSGEGSREHQRWTERLKAHIEATFVNDRDRRFPGDVPRVWLRPIIRAAKMDQSARELPPGEAERVRNLVMNFPGNQRFTVRSVVDTYRTQALLKHMVDKERQDALASAVERDMDWRRDR